MCVRPVRDFVCLFVPPPQLQIRGKKDWEFKLGVDSRAWEGVKSLSKKITGAKNIFAKIFF